MELISTKKIYVVVSSFGSYDDYYEKIVGITFDRNIAEQLKEREEDIHYVIPERDLQCPTAQLENILPSLFEGHDENPQDYLWLESFIDGDKDIVKDDELNDWFITRFGYTAQDVQISYLNERKSYKEYNSTDIREKDFYE